MKKFSSYTVKDSTDIFHYASHCHTPWEETVCFVQTHLSLYPIYTLPAWATSPDTNTRAIFLLALKKAPYCVYGNTFYDYALYGNVFSVNEDGGMDKNIQNYGYQENLGVHGMVFDPTETYLYSADLRANKIWTHRKDETGNSLWRNGQVTFILCE